jgi:uncharacterized membrane protein YeiH
MGYHLQIDHPELSRKKLKMAVVIGVISENFGGVLKGLFALCSQVVCGSHCLDFFSL